MPARFTAYPPEAPAIVRVLDDGALYRIGRSGDCEVRIEHGSISRFHAELTCTGRNWRLDDTGSKNGISVDGRLTVRAELGEATWFLIGDVYCSFEPLDGAAGLAHRAASETRRAASLALSAQLSPNLGAGTLIPQALDTVLQLSGLERGFVLYATAGEPLRVHATRGLHPEDLASASFAGSATAVERALADGKPVVCSDTGDAPWLGARPSIQLGGIRSLLCVPLMRTGASSGVIYADSRTPGLPITELDLELVENVARQTETALEIARADGNARHVVNAGPGSRSMTWRELRKPAFA